MQSVALTDNNLFSQSQSWVPSGQGLVEVLKAAGITMAAVFLPMIAAFFAARSLGLSALCYADLSRQAITAGLAILPFSLYCVVLATRASFRAVLTVGAVVSSILGILAAALV